MDDQVLACYKAFAGMRAAAFRQAFYLVPSTPALYSITA
jgi:hypothetical protein